MRRELLFAGCLLVSTTANAAGKQLLWGDTHLHTTYSSDAYTNNNLTAKPDVAYRYARGMPVVHPYHKARVQIETPLDFLVLTDPTPQAVSRCISPRAFAWTEAMEDHSGLEVDDADWINLDSPPETLNELLCEVGRLFVPFMVENAKAVASGEEMLECELDGRPWVQEAFVYQAKCLTWLKQRYDHLGEMDKARLDNVLSGTGCDALFANKGDKDEKRHSQ